MTIRRADPEAGREALMLVGTVAVAGVLLILLARSQLPAIQAWLTEDLSQTPRRLRILTAGVAVVFGAPMCGFAVKFWRMGARIVETGMLPTPEMKVTRDTRVLEGDAARWRGRFIQMLALSLVAGVLVFVGILWWFAALIESRMP